MANGSDAHQVKALLAQLKSQEERMKAQTPAQPRHEVDSMLSATVLSTALESKTISATDPQLTTPRLNPDISHLLSQISPSVLQLVADRQGHKLDPERKSNINQDIPAQTSDPRSFVFSFLDADSNLVQRLAKLRELQRSVEQGLWTERLKITQIYQGKMDSLSRKITLEGESDPSDPNGSSSKMGIEKLEEAHLAALDQHGLENVLSVWTELLKEQEAELNGVLDAIISQFGSDKLQPKTIISLVEEYMDSQSQRK